MSKLYKLSKLSKLSKMSKLSKLSDLSKLFKVEEAIDKLTGCHPNFHLRLQLYLASLADNQLTSGIQVFVFLCKSQTLVLNALTIDN